MVEHKEHIVITALPAGYQHFQKIKKRKTYSGKTKWILLFPTINLSHIKQNDKSVPGIKPYLQQYCQHYYLAHSQRYEVGACGHIITYTLLMFIQIGI